MSMNERRLPITRTYDPTLQCKHSRNWSGHPPRLALKPSQMIPEGSIAYVQLGADWSSAASTHMRTPILPVPSSISISTLVDCTCS